MKKVIYIPDANETIDDAEIAAIAFLAENYGTGTDLVILADYDAPTEIVDAYSYMTSAA